MVQAFRGDAYAGVFDDLTTATPPFLMGDWSGVRSGYRFTLAGGGTGFTCNADPEIMGATGSQGYFVDASGVIRYAPGAPAGPADPPVGES